MERPLSMLLYHISKSKGDGCMVYDKSMLRDKWTQLWMTRTSNQITAEAKPIETISKGNAYSIACYLPQGITRLEVDDELLEALSLGDDYQNQVLLDSPFIKGAKIVITRDVIRKELLINIERTSVYVKTNKKLTFARQGEIIPVNDGMEIYLGLIQITFTQTKRTIRNNRKNYE